MKLNKKFVTILFTTTILIIIPSSTTAEDFPFALTESDLPNGFILSSTIISSKYHISQSWKTPSDPLGETTLSITNMNTTDAINQLWNTLIMFSNDISISGADKAINYSVIDDISYFASIDTYWIAAGYVMADYDDIKILFEAQIEKINNGSGGASSSGFSLIIGLVSVLTTVTLIKKKRK